MNQKVSDPRHIVYKSNNVLIKFVGDIFFRRVDSLLRSLAVRDKLGVDIGCGEAHLLNRLWRDGAIGKVVAYDLSTENLENAKRRYSHFTYVQGDAQQLAFPDESVDYAMVLEIIEHVPDPEALMREVRRIARPDACILVSVPHEPFFHLANMLRGKYIKKFGKTPAHLSFWGVRQFKTMLRKFFVVEQSFVVSVFPWQLYLCRPKKESGE